MIIKKKKTLAGVHKYLSPTRTAQNGLFSATEILKYAVLLVNVWEKRSIPSRPIWKLETRSRDDIPVPEIKLRTRLSVFLLLISRARSLTGSSGRSVSSRLRRKPPLVSQMFRGINWRAELCFINGAEYEEEKRQKDTLERNEQWRKQLEGHAFEKRQARTSTDVVWGHRTTQSGMF